MQYPSMKSNPTITLNIPAFNGGINQSAPSHAIQDNQVTEIKNMWLKDGVIQTRPALKRGSENAYFLAESGLIDLGIEAKLGYEKDGESIQHTYRLMLTGDKRFLLYDVNLNSFSTVTVEFQKPLYESCLNEGNLSSHFFYTKGFGDFGSNQTFFTEVYGFMMLKNCASIDDKDIMLLVYFSPYVDGEETKYKATVYNFTKDLPEEHQPYYPTVTLDYGTSYGTTLEDFNLLADKFISTYNVNKNLSQIQIIESRKDYVNKGFVKHSALLNWGDYEKGAFGNFNSFEKISFALPGFDTNYFHEAVLYGVFEFYSYKTKKWTLSDFIPSTKIATGTYAATDGGTYDGTDEPESYLEHTADKLVIKINSSNGEVECTFYENGKELHPESMSLDGSNRIRCSGKTTATVTSNELTIWLPSESCDLMIPFYQPLEDELVNHVWVARPATYKTASLFIEQMHVTYYHNDTHGEQEYWDNQNRTELVTRNPLKIWYGGTNSGYAGGTRLFVAGHPEFKNVLRWSGVNDSSYFLENNFAYIGRDDELITALNKQDGYLVVFKEHELYALEYTYTTDEKNNALVYFPVTPISPYIGCDCPDTIQLIANRLTWLTSEGKVYTLYSESNYSERNVREISKHIENVLKTHSKEELQAAKSADYDNNYIIFVGNTAYIWNYDTNPFYNYTSSEQAQKRLAWFSWTFPYPIENAYSVNGDLIVICRSDNGEYQGYVLDYEASDDEAVGEGENHTIKSRIKSKLFDFGRPFAFKRTNRAFADIESHGGGDIFVNFITEHGADNTVIKLTTARNKYEPRSYALRPHLGRVQRIGFEINSETPIKLYSANLTAEIYGEVK